MVSTIEALVDMGCRTPVTVVATHELLVGKAVQHLRALVVLKIVLTDSISRNDAAALPVECVSAGTLLAETIKRLHRRC